jgi:anaerobic selenocysteine-containing dehydrogenase
MTVYVPFDDRARQQTHFSTCYMCACRCGIKVHLRDGRIRYIEGNRNHPINGEGGREVEESRFRLDLFHRLAVSMIRVPPLRERGDDMPLLVNYYLRYAGTNGNEALR